MTPLLPHTSSFFILHLFSGQTCFVQILDYKPRRVTVTRLEGGRKCASVWYPLWEDLAARRCGVTWVVELQLGKHYPEKVREGPGAGRGELWQGIVKGEGTWRVVRGRDGNTLHEGDWESWRGWNRGRVKSWSGKLHKSRLKGRIRVKKGKCMSLEKEGLKWSRDG